MLLSTSTKAQRTDVLMGTPAPTLPSGVAVDRRRPGRPEDVSEQLIPLLRGETDMSLSEPPLVPDDLFAIDPEDAVGPPMQGIASAVLLSSVLWGMAGVAGWVLLR